jgi:hypothetical protein
VKPPFFPLLAGMVLGIGAAGVGRPAEDTVAVAVSARTGNGYKRERAKNGSFQPEYYALSEGGRIAGTTSDFTVDKVVYHDLAETAMRFLGQQNYRYYGGGDATAKLLLVLFWGSTIAERGTSHERTQPSIALELEALKRLNQGEDLEGTAPAQPTARTPYASREQAAAADTERKRMLLAPKTRERLQEHNGQVLGYTNDLKAADGVQRWAGGGDRYNDLVADLDESRYYIVILAYDFEEYAKRRKKKLLWTSRMSVSSAGNRFDESVGAMFRAAAKDFGQDRGQLVRREEAKAKVEVRDLKFMGEAADTPAGKADGRK